MQVPWWFGAQDMYLSAFGLVWLVCVSLMGALAVTGGSGAWSIPGFVHTWFCVTQHPRGLPGLNIVRYPPGCFAVRTAQNFASMISW